MAQTLGPLKDPVVVSTLCEERVLPAGNSSRCLQWGVPQRPGPLCCMAPFALHLLVRGHLACRSLLQAESVSGPAPLSVFCSFSSLTSFLGVIHSPGLGPSALDFAACSSLPFSVLLVPSLTSTLPSLPLPGPIPPWVCLAQGRLSEEIEKLRQEVDQLKGRGGPFVDGIHSRY